jgi:hypothetical protein
MIEKEELKKTIEKELKQLNLTADEEDQLMNELIILSDLVLDIAINYLFNNN